MRYNPFAYVHSEKDILKLVTTLMANTKGDGKSGDGFEEGVGESGDASLPDSCFYALRA